MTKDVEINKSQSGTSVAAFTVACNRVGKKGEKAVADFIRCIAFSQTAEYAGNYAKKGNMVAVDGRIQTGSYSRNGQTVYTTDVIAERFRLLEKKDRQASNEYSDYEFNVDDLGDYDF